MTLMHRTANLAAAATLSTLVLVACGGGGSPSEGPVTGPAADTQTLPTARAVFDIARATAFLSADVQNIIVFAPALVARGDLTENCDLGGTLQTTVLRDAAHPAGPLVRQQFNDCRSTPGILLRGVTEVAYTRRTSEAADLPWAGSISFSDYRIESTAAPQRQRRYDGLAVAEGSLGAGGGLAQGRTMRLTAFTLQDNPDTLGRGGLVSTTALFELQRAPGGIGDLYTLQGRWQQQSGALRVDLTLDAGSQVSLVENIAAETARGSIAWADTTVPAFSGRFVLRPSGRVAVRVELDLGADGSVDRDAVLDRYTQIGVGI
jgi:hypothetical protein